MDLQQLNILVKSGESHRLELKASTGQLRRACETACAFLNADGGTVLFGVTDDGRIKGQDVADKTKRELGSDLAKMSPTPDVEIVYIPVCEDKYVIALQAKSDSSKKPYFYDGRAYMRLQSETYVMPREHMLQLILNNADVNHQWENLTQNLLQLDDLDTAEILSTLKEGILNGRIPENYATSDPWLALQHFGLVSNDKLTNAAVVLFAKHPELKFPQCLLMMARFRGTNKAEFIDHKQVSGNAFKLLREAMSFAMTYLPISSTFPSDSFQRIDTPLFPIPVLREAIANAICHRDYTHGGGSISFAIFDDRIEIWNYGLFPTGVSLDNLRTLNKSLPRNRLIAKVFYYHRICETWGRGVDMIVTDCKKAGHPEPFYTQAGGSTLLTLPSYQRIGDTRADWSVKISENSYTRRQIEIIELLKANDELAPNEILKLMSLPPAARTLREELVRMNNLGIIFAVGSSRARKWKLRS